MNFVLIVFCSGFVHKAGAVFLDAIFAGQDTVNTSFLPSLICALGRFFVGRTLFRSFDENADGTVSQHEFRKGVRNLGYSTF